MKHYTHGDQLAKDMKISPEHLQKTFDTYNACAKANKDPYNKKFFPNAPFNVNDQFHVAEVTPVIHYTMGGIKLFKIRNQNKYRFSMSWQKWTYLRSLLLRRSHGRSSRKKQTWRKLSS